MGSFKNFLTRKKDGLKMAIILSQLYNIFCNDQTFYTGIFYWKCLLRLWCHMNYNLYDISDEFADNKHFIFQEFGNVVKRSRLYRWPWCLLLDAEACSLMLKLAADAWCLLLLFDACCCCLMLAADSCCLHDACCLIGQSIKSSH